MALKVFWQFAKKRHSLFSSPHEPIQSVCTQFYYIVVCVPLAAHSIPVYKTIKWCPYICSEPYKFLYFCSFQMAFLLCFSGENKIKAGKLNVMQALLDVMHQHKSDPRVAEDVAGALRNICVNGGLIITIFLFRIFSIFLYEYKYAWLILYIKQTY